MTTISYKGREVPLDQAEGLIREGVMDALERARETRRSERLLAAVRYIQRQGGPEVEPEAPYPAPPAELFQDPDDPSGWRDFLPAPDLEEIGKRLIGECEELKHIADYRVLYLWKRKGGQRAGQPTLGKCIKASGPAKHFGDCTWIVWLAAGWTIAYGLTRRQVEAALHHELLHAGEKEIKVTRPDGLTDTKVVPAVKGHDAEMFRSEVERYGLWRLPLQEVAPAFRQLSMFDEMRGVPSHRDGRSDDAIGGASEVGAIGHGSVPCGKAELECHSARVSQWMSEY